MGFLSNAANRAALLQRGAVALHDALLAIFSPGDDEFQVSWQRMLDEGIYTSFTEHNSPVTTDRLAVFLSRTLKLLDHG
jgi:hypothetical protein